MHGMLSAAIILVVFALVAAAGGGSTVWLYRAAAGPSRRSRPVSETGPTRSEPAPGPAPDAPETIPDLVAPEAGGARAAADTEGDDARPEDAQPAGPEVSEGARIYVLDSSRRSGR